MNFRNKKKRRVWFWQNADSTDYLLARMERISGKSLLISTMKTVCFLSGDLILAFELNQSKASQISCPITKKTDFKSVIFTQPCTHLILNSEETTEICFRSFWKNFVKVTVFIIFKELFWRDIFTVNELQSACSVEKWKICITQKNFVKSAFW